MELLCTHGYELKIRRAITNRLSFNSLFLLCYIKVYNSNETAKMTPYVKNADLVDIMGWFQIRNRCFELQVGRRRRNIHLMTRTTRILFTLYVNFADFSHAEEPGQKIMRILLPSSGLKS